jgi:hypothetical protein
MRCIRRSRHLALLIFLGASSAIAPDRSLASGQVDLQLGTRIAYKAYGDGALTARPAIAVEGFLRPGQWPVGVAGYVSAAADWYEGVTLEYPGFGDWLSAHYRVTAGEVGVGLKKSLPVGRSRLSLGIGVMGTYFTTR